MRVLRHSVHYAALSVIAVVTLFPIYWMFMSSLRAESEMFRYTELSWKVFLPVDWTLANFKDIFLDPEKPFTRYMINTFIMAGTVTAAGLLINSAAAFAFAKLRFPFKRLVLVVFLSTLAIPPEVVMVPQYLIIRDMHALNTFAGLIMPSIVWVFGIFMLTQFFADIPRDILDAARIDGSSWLRIYTRIVLPGAVPALITLGIITFTHQWDSLLWPLIIISDDTKQVVQAVISSYTSDQEKHWGKIVAAASASSLPILTVFLFLQKYYVRGVMMSGVKG
ncbi:ABC transporter permease subunit [Cohnella sp. CFH 77786]|uniref:carbohydrate ABC transporter permease n=1 Tax=Cohnella sp. CFH 77786 TaxID=2662265 RepID=UPI001C60F453|nr:carbohydrate ABC transporter permease [Cohnella sp. CFH 77786]MBW5444809.1 ABC transporter permease subunit [Cohnella sp. CFH 77786]